MEGQELLKEYRNWIEDYICKNDIRNMCYRVAEEMTERFPELNRVEGHLWLKDTKKPIKHFWCEDKNGNVIDPTISQFSLEIEKYVKADDTICWNCGKEIQNNIIDILNLTKADILIIYDITRHLNYCCEACLDEDIKEMDKKW